MKMRSTGTAQRLAAFFPGAVAALGLAVLLMLSACAPKPGVMPAPGPVTPPSAAELYRRGEQMLEAGDREGALTLFNAYLARFPKGVMADEAMMHIGAIHTAAGRYAAARQTYAALIEAYPQSPLITDARAALLEAHFNEGRYEEVIAAFADIEKDALTPAQARKALVLTGDAHWITGSPSRAAFYYAVAHDLAPEDQREALRSKIRTALGMLTPEAIDRLIDGTLDVPAQSLLREIARPFAFRRLSLGCLLPLSGKYAGYGQKALRGVELALHRFGLERALPGLKIVVKDTAGDPEKAARAVRELVADDQVAAAIGPFITAETAALEAQKAGLPIVTMTQKDHITRIGDYVFRNFFTPEMQVRALVSYCTGTLGLERFAILYPDEPYGRRFMDLFWDGLIAAGATVAGVESYDPAVTDFADPIRKLVGLYYDIPPDLRRRPAPPEETLSPASQAPGEVSPPEGAPEEADDGAVVDFEAVFIPDAPNKAGLIIPQLAYHDVRDVYLLGTNLWFSQNLIDMTRQYAQGALMPVGFFPESASVRVRRFVEAFRATYGEVPGFIEAVAYDTAMMLLTAVGDPRTESRERLRDTLLDAGVYQGVTGPTAFDPEGDVIKTLRLVRVRGGEFVELNPEPDETTDLDAAGDPAPDAASGHSSVAGSGSAPAR